MNGTARALAFSSDGSSLFSLGGECAVLRGPPGLRDFEPSYANLVVAAFRHVAELSRLHTDPLVPWPFGAQATVSCMCGTWRRASV